MKTTLTQLDSENVSKLVENWEGSGEVQKHCTLNLHDSRCTYRSLFENLLNAVAHCQMLYQNPMEPNCTERNPEDFIFLSVNAAFVTQIGLQDVVGCRVSEIVPAFRSRDPEFFEIIERVICTGLPERFELYLTAVRQWISAAVYSPSKEHFVLVFDVITERKKNDEHIRKLSQVVEQNPNSIMIANTAAEIRYVNESFTRITGYTLEEVKGKNPRFLQSGKTERKIYQTMWTALEKGDSWQGEFINRRKNGEIFIEHEIFSPIRQPDGRITHYLCIKEDVTEKKRLQEELEQYRQNLEELVEERTRQWQETNRALEKSVADFTDLYNNAPCGYHSLDVRGRYISVNDTELNMLGYTREELIGRKTIRDLMTKESQERMISNCQTLLKSGRLRDVEYTLVRKDGSLLPVVIHMDTVHDAKGNFLYSRATLFNDTERQRREHQILLLNRHYWAELARRAEEAEAATRAKSAFLANMSHEIRTPMNAIIGFSHLLRKDILDKNQIDKIDKIASAATHLLSIINSILDLSKIEAGRLQIENVDFSLQDVLEKISTMIRPRAREKGLSFRLESAVLQNWWQGDPTRISQIILNYLDNAIKFTNRGEIVLRVRVIEDDEIKGSLFRFEVQDSGIGLEPEKQARLFSAFEQGDASTTRRYGGTGLGLAINRRLATLMGGEAGVESVFGYGSLFWVTVRLSKGMAPATNSKIQNAELCLIQEYQGNRILVVEDDVMNQEVAKGLLEGVGLLVDLAENGKIALEKVQKQTYDLILMDSQLPIMDGFLATRSIRILPKPRIPIVAMTASAFTEDRQQCLAVGMDDFVAKPVVPEDLFSCLVRWLPKRYQEKVLISENVQQTLPHHVQQIPGLDVSQGLRHQKGRVENYLQLLQDFIRYHRNDMEEFSKNMKSGDRNSAVRIIHTLKSVAGLLGATALQSSAHSLEIALRRMIPQTEPLQEATTEELSILISTLQNIPLGNVISNKTQVDEQTQDQLSRLEHLLTSNDYLARTFLQKHHELFKTIFGEVINELDRLISRFEYDSALSLVKTVRRTN
ncbi:two-component system, sensor histidine kinase and response regulator [Gammaproteobacteria bacterium]